MPFTINIPPANVSINLPYILGSYGYVKEFCECSELNLGCFVKPLVSGRLWEPGPKLMRTTASWEDTMTTMTMGSGEAASRVPFSQYRFKMVDVYRKLETVNLKYL